MQLTVSSSSTAVRSVNKTKRQRFAIMMSHLERFVCKVKRSSDASTEQVLMLKWYTYSLKRLKFKTLLNFMLKDNRWCSNRLRQLQTISRYKLSHKENKKKIDDSRTDHVSSRPEVKRRVTAVTNKKLLYIYDTECVFHECREIYYSRGSLKTFLEKRIHKLLTGV